MALPFHGIFGALSEEMDEKAASLKGDATQAATPQQEGVGRVAVDIYEQDGYYIIRAPIAGVRMSDLDIEVNDHVLTIRGNRKQVDDVPSHQFYLQECFWGPFSRSVTLPIIIDPRKVKATFNKDCILKILIPKEEKVKIVKISEAI